MSRPRSGQSEIRAALGRSRRLFLAIGVFSAFVNVLMLTGPLFMLQVYDRVLTSRSEATLTSSIRSSMAANFLHPRRWSGQYIPCNQV